MTEALDLERPALPVPARGSRIRPHPWLQVVGVWLASRIVTTAVMLFFAAAEPRTFWAAADPPYFRFAQFWDSGWFHTVATAGYPLQLPRDATGHVVGNAWAFLPAYPAVVGVVQDATGIPWDVASVLVSAACSLAAALVLARLLEVVLGRRALFAVALFCFGPLSPVLQVAYAESMAVLLLAVLLLLLVRRHYLAMLPVIVLVGLTRPVAVPVAATLAIHVVLRIATRRRDPFPLRQAGAALLATAVAAGTAALWPVVAWLATGEPSAYLESELAWRTVRVGSGPLVPFEAWSAAASRWVGPWGPLLLLLVVLGLAACLLLVPSVRRLGTDVRIWLATYAAYLLAVFDPQSSTFRLLLPLFPLVGAVTPRSRILRAGLLVACVAGQAVWFGVTWARWNVQGWSPP